MVGVRVANGKALMVLVAAVLVMCAGGLLPAAEASGRKEVHLVPAVYVFGDSTVDVGNNQYLPGNGPLQLPYGIDFPHSRATGRFSNGYNVADSISRLLGFKRSPPAYLSLTPRTSRQIYKGFRGVNYASGGSGILDTTGNTLTLSKQVELFAATKSKMTTKYPGGRVDARLSKSLFLISDGGNDMFAFISQNRTAAEAPSFYTDLLSNYTKHVQTLYSLGARRFGIVDVPPIGCVPAVRAKSPSGETSCVAAANALAEGFNDALGKTMAKLASALPGMRYSVGSSYNLVTFFTAHPEATGFRDVASACCGGGRLGVQTGCVPNATYCGNRNDHLFWDGVHGTHATSNKGAKAIFAAPVKLGFAAPINFKQLISS
uniref:Uncharacterized protein n=1 Tax=Avena sativa TaxID=4498 RepID=A0ACD5YK98_AVESA